MDQSSVRTHQSSIVAPPRDVEIEIGWLRYRPVANHVKYRIRQDRLRLAHRGKAERIDNVASLYRRVLLREDPQSLGAALQIHHVSSLLISNYAPHTHFVAYGPLW